MTEREFEISVMGKTLEHLGSQLYKKRDAALAELIANAWDAGATRVEVTLPAPESYDGSSSQITVTDNGSGMSPEEIDSHYLVVGRNRRLDQSTGPRKPMGRKGIGKLAGFGIARTVEIITWQNSVASSVVMPIDTLSFDETDIRSIKLPGKINQAIPSDARGSSGTRVVLSSLRQKTALEPDTLRESLGRRFARSVRGEMTIAVNGIEILSPNIDLEYRSPQKEGEWHHVTLPDGNEVRYFYGFARQVLHPVANRGFAVFVHGKTAQAPPFFFGVESKASGQFGASYLYGEIEADFLDDDQNPEPQTTAASSTDNGDTEEQNIATEDVISTDRQEIDWEHPRTSSLSTWGDSMARRALEELREFRQKSTENWIYDDPELKARIERLDSTSQNKIRKFIKMLGLKEGLKEQESIEFAGSIIAAFEFRHFHDIVGEIEAASEDPESLAKLLVNLKEWKVLESRALLEVVTGRLAVVHKFGHLVSNDAPEKPGRTGDENLHDLLTAFPWLINPDWQVFEHEKSVSNQLVEWDAELKEEDDKSRVDFLAFAGPNELAVVEIKRPGHSVEMSELQRLQTYLSKLEPAYKGRQGGETFGLLVASELNFSENHIPPNIRWERWADLLTRGRKTYTEYGALLEADSTGQTFARHGSELAQTRSLVDAGSYIDKSAGKPRIGPQGG